MHTRVLFTSMDPVLTGRHVHRLGKFVADLVQFEVSHAAMGYPGCIGTERFSDRTLGMPKLVRQAV